MAQQQDNAPNKPVHLMFFGGGLLFFYLLTWTADWIWGYFTRTPSELYITLGSAVVAIVVGVSMYRNVTVNTLANEVAAELKKVTWPTGKEVKVATVVVVVMAIISALILGLFDAVWSAVTRLIYG